MQAVAMSYEGSMVSGCAVFSKYLGNCSVCISELWGVLLCLELAWTCGFKRVDLQMDSKGKYPQFKKGREG